MSQWIESHLHEQKNWEQERELEDQVPEFETAHILKRNSTTNDPNPGVGMAIVSSAL